MANRQITDYIKSQMAQGIPLEQLRALLIKQGWTVQDVTEAVDEVMGKAKGQVHKDHQKNFVGIAVLSVVVLMLIGGLFLLVFGRNDGVEPITETSINLPINPKPPAVTAWAVCADEVDGFAKDACYQKLHKESDNYFDCKKISDSVEYSFCTRAQETVLIEKYNAQL